MMRQRVRVVSSGETGVVMGRCELVSGACYWLVSASSDVAKALEGGRLVDVADVELLGHDSDGAAEQCSVGYQGQGGDAGGYVGQR